VPTPPLPLLRWQFDLTWSLLELHLADLTDDDCRWEPAPACWSVRPGPDGRWYADWVSPEPDPPPVATIGWVSWHIGWWWTRTLAGLAGTPAPEPQRLPWPGGAAGTVAWLGRLRADWLAVLDRLTEDDLAAPAAYPWRDRPDRTVGHTVAWVNAELMKNTAEIGQLRLLRRSAG